MGKLCRILGSSVGVDRRGCPRRDGWLAVIGAGISVVDHGKSFRPRNALWVATVPSRHAARRIACPFRRALVRAPLRFSRASLPAVIVGLLGVAQLVDVLDLGSIVARCWGSCPFALL